MHVHEDRVVGDLHVAVVQAQSRVVVPALYVHEGEMPRDVTGKVVLAAPLRSPRLHERDAAVDLPLHLVAVSTSVNGPPVSGIELESPERSLLGAREVADSSRPNDSIP